MIKKKVVKSYDEILDVWQSKISRDKIIDDDGNEKELTLSQAIISNLIIDFDITIPFPDEYKDKVEIKNRHLFIPTSFLDCEFLKTIEIINKGSKFFERCIFPKFELVGKYHISNLTFKSCQIDILDFENTNFGDKDVDDNEGKIRFHNCDLYKVDFTNTTFGNLADFYGTTFHDKIIFQRTDFLGTVVFSSTTFKENALFTYVLFKKSGIFNQTIFKKGLDLSQCIVEGNLTFFETDLNNYESKRISIGNYHDAINLDGDIPNQNKRETFRIIKNQLIQQNNPIVAEKYLKLEKQAFLEEKNIEAIFEDNVIKTFKILLSDYIILKLNKYSNNFKTSWLYGLAFTFIVALIFHLMLSISVSYRLNEVKNFVSLINLTDFDLLNKARSNIFYITVFVAKLSLGFAIYQLIQAFRKFK